MAIVVSLCTTDLMAHIGILGDFAVFFGPVYALGLPWTSRGSGDVREQLTIGARLGMDDG